jgi:hypothetical protein
MIVLALITIGVMIAGIFYIYLVLAVNPSMQEAYN